MQRDLKFNICNIKSSLTTNDNIPRPLDFIGEALAYGCQYWWAHVKCCTGMIRRSIRLLIWETMEKWGLFWIEVMAWLGLERVCRDILIEISTASSVRLSHSLLNRAGLDIR
jgi:hypothetical protein